MSGENSSASSVSNSLIKIDMDLTKPAVVLIEKVSNAIGGYWKPYQIREIAKAEVEAEKIRAAGQIEITELHQRALRRFIAEEAKHQANIEAITQEALPYVKEDAKAVDVEDDWLSHFFGECRTVSDEEMQKIWSAVLAGEANTPGTYSKRTVTMLSSLDKKDAALFQRLCGFVWMISGPAALVFDLANPIYSTQGITFQSLSHLDAIGLINFQGVAGLRLSHLPKKIDFFYYGERVRLEFPKENENALDMGHVMLSESGQQLAQVVKSSKSEAFKVYVFDYWRSKGLIVDTVESPQNSRNSDASSL
ncbi:DUF2806 domain-containing protein [Lignipirellula cremea]|nr:DUF2806 domain-containing protein [Lignipirellula cremea]